MIHIPYLTGPVNLKEELVFSKKYAITEHNMTIKAFLDVESSHKVFFRPFRPGGRFKSFIF